MKVQLVCIAMWGNQYVLYGGAFPEGELRPGEQPAEAMRRLVKDTTGTDAPKLEVVDMHATPDALLLVLRALLTSEPRGAFETRARMELPARVGRFSAKEVEDLLKTGLNYKLTRG